MSLGPFIYWRQEMAKPSVGRLVQGKVRTKPFLGCATDQVTVN